MTYWQLACNSNCNVSMYLISCNNNNQFPITYKELRLNTLLSTRSLETNVLRSTPPVDWLLNYHEGSVASRKCFYTSEVRHTFYTVEDRLRAGVAATLRVIYTIKRMTQWIDVLMNWPISGSDDTSTSCNYFLIWQLSFWTLLLLSSPLDSISSYLRNLLLHVMETE